MNLTLALRVSAFVWATSRALVDMSLAYALICASLNSKKAVIARVPLPVPISKRMSLS